MLRACLLSRCPRCGKGTIFNGLLAIREACPACGLSLKDHDAGDGPAFFALLIVGFAGLGFSGWIELAYAPAWWVHAVTFVPFTCLASLWVIRLCKTWLIALQYKYKPESFS